MQKIEVKEPRLLELLKRTLQLVDESQRLIDRARELEGRTRHREVEAKEWIRRGETKS